MAENIVRFIKTQKLLQLDDTFTLKMIVKSKEKTNTEITMGEWIFEDLKTIKVKGWGEKIKGRNARRIGGQL